MRILLTANALTGPSGTSLYTQEIAESLQACGHEPACFSLRLGEIAQRLGARGIPVSDDLRALPPPDAIHGQHYIETTLAAITHRRVPVISFCHGPEAWQESVCRMPNTVQYVAVDAACQRRLVEDEGIRPEQVRLLLNHFDDRRFHLRTPLPARPRRALMVSNRLASDDPIVRMAAEACRQRGIEFGTVGARFGNRSESLETLLPLADIVFAKARCAVEAMAVGCSVIQLDHLGAGRLITSELFDELRPLNFGYRSMVYPVDLTHLGAQIDAYDPEDAAVVSRRIRSQAPLSANVAVLLDLYQAAAARGSLPEYDPAVAAADFLRFQLFLSKLPYDRLVKTKGVPLRLPTQEVPPGEVSAMWEHIAAQHQRGASGRPRTAAGRIASALHGAIDRLLP